MASTCRVDTSLHSCPGWPWWEMLQTLTPAGCLLAAALNCNVTPHRIHRIHALVVHARRVADTTSSLSLNQAACTKETVEVSRVCLVSLG